MDLAHVFLLTDLLDHEFEALSRFINLGTQLHTKLNLKHWARLTLRHVLVKEPTTERFTFTVLWMNLLQNDSISQSREMNQKTNLSTDEFSLTSSSGHELLVHDTESSRCHFSQIS